MAGVFRSMLFDDGKPVVGDQSKMLGVRHNGHDIPIDEDQMVRPKTGGLSVAPDWRVLPYFLIPRRLQNKSARARGNNNLACFRFEGLEFQEVQINVELVLQPDSGQHGTIEPNREMTLATFQSSLAGTRDSWTIDEN